MGKQSIYTIFGESKSLTLWSNDPRCKVSYSTLVDRITRKKWEPTRAVIEPSNGFGQANLIGKKFGRLTVISLEGTTRQRQTIWKCICECQKEKTIPIGRLISGHTLSCGCLKRERAIERCKRLFSLPKGHANFNRIISDYKKCAARRGLSWELSDKEFKVIILSNCRYCGDVPKNESHFGSSENGILKRNGVDRKDNSLGYNLQNCVPCCKSCNYAKRDMSETEFLNKAKQIAQYNNL